MSVIPPEVRAWFAGAVTDEDIAGHLETLRIDPDWRVRAFSSRSAWTLNLSYLPTGERVGIVLRRHGPLWRGNT